MNFLNLRRSRREFLRDSLVGCALASTVPTFLARTWTAMAGEAPGASGGGEEPVLVVLQLAGGNDGLNTVVPLENDHYARARRQLGLAPKDLLRIHDDLGFHPALTGFRSLYDEGRLAIIQGVGYPNPNRSHFRSVEIWQTASDADRYRRDGWIGRYFDHACRGCDPVVGVSLGRQMPQAFGARRPTGVAYALQNRGTPDRGAARRKGEVRKLGSTRAGEGGAGDTIGALDGRSMTTETPLDFLDRTAWEAQSSNRRLREILGRVRNHAEYPGTPLAQSFRAVAQWIAGGLPTRIYYLSQGGYDTHAAQAATHGRLLEELGDAVRAFEADLTALGQIDRVLVLVFSEFGRRVAENGSGGTDHGAAGPMFLMGTKLAAGLIGVHPSLDPADLVAGDLRHAIDFRSVYAAVLEEWLRAPSEAVLGRAFDGVRLTKA